MGTFLVTRPQPSIELDSFRVVCATVPLSSGHIVFATDTPHLISSATPGEKHSLSSHVTQISSTRYSSFNSHSLPQQNTLILALTQTSGLQLFDFPQLELLSNEWADRLAQVTSSTKIFSIDSLGSDLVGESFRIAIASLNSVSLLDINPGREKLTVLGQFEVQQHIVSIAFSEMTIALTTVQTHHLLRISRGGGLALAASVPRFDRIRRGSASSAVNDGSAAVISFLGGLLGRRHPSNTLSTPLAFALPDDRWLLTVDQELVAYSSFGAKLEELENVFKSKHGMDVVQTAPPDDESRGMRNSIAKSNSVSSIGSLSSSVSHMTMLDQSRAARSERPPLLTLFSSPFIMTVAPNNELIAYAANGSVQGIMDRVPLVLNDEENTAPVERAKLVISRYEKTLATAYWPDGTYVRIDLVDDLENLIEKQEAANELRYALGLVPADQVDRMIALRRSLATQARDQDWHDAAIHHMESVVNLSMRAGGSDQPDLVSDAVDLLGDSSLKLNPVVMTMWADFLFRLRRRTMRPSSADLAVLETICRADESADRVKALLSVKHDVPLAAGESAITALDSSLREEERVAALVALYTSLAENGKALLLLENSNRNTAFDEVAGYLSTIMRPADDPDVYFHHVKWLAEKSKGEAQGQRKLERVVFGVLADTGESEVLMSRLVEVIVEEADHMTTEVVEKMCDSFNSPRHTCPDSAAEKSSTSTSANTVALAVLSGMVRADVLKKRDVFQQLRSIFRSRILHSSECRTFDLNGDRSSPLHSYSLLQALQSSRHKALGLHEEEAFLLGQQGRHEAAADELAAEQGLAAEQALVRLRKLLPASDTSFAAESLVAAYLRVSSERRAMRITDAGAVLRCGAGAMEVEKLLLDGRCGDEALKLCEIHPFLKTALVVGSERLKIAGILRSLRKSEVGRMREEVLSRRRRAVVVGHDRACTLCTRRIGDAVLVSHPDSSVTHLACHMSRESSHVAK